MIVINLGVASILVAEATPMKNEIRVTVQAICTNIYIGENKIIIQVVEGHIQMPSAIQVLIQQIHSYFQSRNYVIVSRIFREDSEWQN